VVPPKKPPPLYVRIQKGQKNVYFRSETILQSGRRSSENPGLAGRRGFSFSQQAMTIPPGGRRLPLSAYRLPIYMLGEVKKNRDSIPSIPASGFCRFPSYKRAGFSERGGFWITSKSSAGRADGSTCSISHGKEVPTCAAAPKQGDVVFVHADTTPKFERKDCFLYHDHLRASPPSSRRPSCGPGLQ